MNDQAGGARWEKVAEILAEQIRRGRSRAAAVDAMSSAARMFPESRAEYETAVRLVVAERGRP